MAATLLTACGQKHLFLMQWLLIYVHTTTVGQFQLVISLLASENLLKHRSLLVSSVTCASRVVATPAYIPFFRVFTQHKL